MNDCTAAATDRIEITDAAGDIDGCTYTCPEHLMATVAAIGHTGAAAVVHRVGEFEPAHRCGVVVSYVGARPGGGLL